MTGEAIGEHSNIPESLKHPESILVVRTHREIVRHESQISKPPEGGTDDDRYLTPGGAEHAMMVSPHSGLGEWSEGDYAAKITKIQASPAIRAALASVLRSYGLTAVDPETGEIKEGLQPGEQQTYQQLIDLTEGLLNKEPRLAFNIGDRESGYGKAFIDAANEKRLVPYIYEQSDRDAAAQGDPNLDSYSTFAANVASIIKEDLHEASERNYQIGDLAKRGSDPVKVQDNFVPTTTHAGVGESFWIAALKAVAIKEKQDPDAAVERFLNAIDKNSFGFSEGIEVITSDYDGLMKPTVDVKYTRRDQSGKTILDEDGKPLYQVELQLDEDMLDQMIAKGASRGQ